MVWDCGVTLERAAPGDIYPSYATELNNRRLIIITILLLFFDLIF